MRSSFEHWAAFCATALWLVLLIQRSGLAQVDLGPLVWQSEIPQQLDLSGTCRFAQADQSVLTLIEQVKQYLARQHWQDAFDTLEKIRTRAGNDLVPVSPWLYVTGERYCRLILSGLEGEALAAYRKRVDPLAKRWYEDGLQQFDTGQFERVVQQAWGSSWTDDCLLLLGDAALEQGHWDEARRRWTQIVARCRSKEEICPWPSVPEPDVDLAAVRARLVLASILAGQTERAQQELERFAKLHPEAEGTIGGKSGKYVDLLQQLLIESRSWPLLQTASDWNTFAGNSSRNFCPEQEGLEPISLLWQVSLPVTPPADTALMALGFDVRRSAESPRRPLSYFPVVADNVVFVCSSAEVLAFDLATGQPAWGAPYPVVYRDQSASQVFALEHVASFLGTSRFTATIAGGKLLARIGVPVTVRPPAIVQEPSGTAMVALDLNAQGRLLWRVVPPENDLAFEGAPVSDGRRAYVVLRKSALHPQISVAAYELSTGRLVWHTQVCSAATVGQGVLSEASHLLLTLVDDTLYLNTNMGAVAALAAETGRIKWLALYPRAEKGSLSRLPIHFSRSLTPCLYADGTLFVAPADSPRIFAFDAASGQLLWHTGPELADVVHLLGCTGKKLIASGGRLYWISTEGNTAGKVSAVWPDSQEQLGWGRGLIVANRILWPTQRYLMIFDAQQCRLVKQIDLSLWGLTGGNLAMVDHTLLLATADRLAAFSVGRKPASVSKVPQLAFHGLAKRPE